MLLVTAMIKYKLLLLGNFEIFQPFLWTNGGNKISLLLCKMSPQGSTFFYDFVHVYISRIPSLCNVDNHGHLAPPLPPSSCPSGY